MNSLYIFDKLSSIRFFELVNKAITQATTERDIYIQKYDALVKFVPKSKPGIWNNFKWIAQEALYCNDSIHHHYNARHFLKIASNALKTDVEQLNRVMVALNLSPQFVAADQQTLDLVNKYIDQDVITERNTWLADILNTDN